MSHQALQFNGEIIVDGENVTVRCLVDGCTAAGASSDGYTKFLVRRARLWMELHREFAHRDSTKSAHVRLVTQTVSQESTVASNP